MRRRGLRVPIGETVEAMAERVQQGKVHRRNLGALTLRFTAAQLAKLDAAAGAVAGARSADPAWVSEGRE